jgi:hypothetical protein
MSAVQLWLERVSVLGDEKHGALSGRCYPLSLAALEDQGLLASSFPFLPLLVPRHHHQLRSRTAAASRPPVSLCDMVERLLLFRGSEVSIRASNIH